MYLPNLFATGRMRHEVIFQSSLNSKFHFLTNCLIKAKETFILYYLTIAEKMIWIHSQLKDMNTK